MDNITYKMAKFTKDLRYEDLGPAEIGAFVVVIALLILLGAVPEGWMEAGVTMLARIQGGVS